VFEDEIGADMAAVNPHCNHIVYDAIVNEAARRFCHLPPGSQRRAEARVWAQFVLDVVEGADEKLRLSLTGAEVSWHDVVAQAIVTMREIKFEDGSSPGSRLAQAEHAVIAAFSTGSQPSSPAACNVPVRSDGRRDFSFIGNDDVYFDKSNAIVDGDISDSSDEVPDGVDALIQCQDDDDTRFPDMLDASTLLAVEPDSIRTWQPGRIFRGGADLGQHMISPAGFLQDQRGPRRLGTFKTSPDLEPRFLDCTNEDGKCNGKCLEGVSPDVLKIQRPTSEAAQDALAEVFNRWTMWELRHNAWCEDVCPSCPSAAPTLRRQFEVCWRERPRAMQVRCPGCGAITSPNNRQSWYGFGHGYRGANAAGVWTAVAHALFAGQSVQSIAEALLLDVETVSAKFIDLAAAVSQFNGIDQIGRAHTVVSGCIDETIACGETKYRGGGQRLQRKGGPIWCSMVVALTTSSNNTAGDARVVTWIACKVTPNRGAAHVRALGELLFAIRALICCDGYAAYNTLCADRLAVLERVNHSAKVWKNPRGFSTNPIEGANGVVKWLVRLLHGRLGAKSFLATDLRFQFAVAMYNARAWMSPSGQQIGGAAVLHRMLRVSPRGHIPDAFFRHEAPEQMRVWWTSATNHLEARLRELAVFKERFSAILGHQMAYIRQTSSVMLRIDTIEQAQRRIEGPRVAKRRGRAFETMAASSQDAPLGGGNNNDNDNSNDNDDDNGNLLGGGAPAATAAPTSVASPTPAAKRKYTERVSATDPNSTLRSLAAKEREKKKKEAAAAALNAAAPAVATPAAAPAVAPAVAPAAAAAAAPAAAPAAKSGARLPPSATQREFARQVADNALATDEVRNETAKKKADNAAARERRIAAANQRAAELHHDTVDNVLNLDDVCDCQRLVRAHHLATTGDTTNPFVIARKCAFVARDGTECGAWAYGACTGMRRREECAENGERLWASDDAADSATEDHPAGDARNWWCSSHAALQPNRFKVFGSNKVRWHFGGL
jgi:hypothetical protein